MHNNNLDIAQILHLIASTLENTNNQIPTVRGVTEHKFAEMQGLGYSTIQKARSSGKFPEGKVWFKCPATGRFLYDINGYNKWLEEMNLINQNTKGLKSEVKKSALPSTSKQNVIELPLTKDLLN